MIKLLKILQEVIEAEKLKKRIKQEGNTTETDVAVQSIQIGEVQAATSEQDPNLTVTSVIDEEVSVTEANQETATEGIINVHVYSNFEVVSCVRIQKLVLEITTIQILRLPSVGTGKDVIVTQATEASAKIVTTPAVVRTPKVIFLLA